MANPVEYKVITASNAGAMTRQLNDASCEGWRVQGSVHCVITQEQGDYGIVNEYQYTATMVRFS